MKMAYHLSALKKKKIYLLNQSYVAGVLGFEPRMAVPKTAALPLGYTPKLNSYSTKKMNYIVFDTMNK